ncbi:MAG TPA: methyltransferase domain-containing protein [Candidatus Nanoarchaeia archaeon]|nr:methyltransferase domain-containing protein [Candidatus Nanoarchaeia archaeon]
MPKIIIDKETGTKYVVKNSKEDFHTSAGVIKSKDLQSTKEIVTSSKGKDFFILQSQFSDLWENMQRGPQLMLPKDIGWILAKTGINVNSKVVDAGGGSGSLCLSLANVCKEVTAYESNTEHHRILLKNVTAFGLSNIKVKQEDIYKGITEKEVDLITLDLPEPWKVTAHAEKALKNGGFVVVYCPQINQAKQFIDSVKGTRIKIMETVELLERKWKIEDRIMRPEFEMLGHTGFLTLGRKM